MSDKPKVRTCLWFDGNGEEANGRRERSQHHSLISSHVEVSALTGLTASRKHDLRKATPPASWSATDNLA